jgi:hypothetical protein
VIAINAMAFLDTMVHGETAFLAEVAEERKIGEAVFGEGHGIDDSHRIVFPNPRTMEYRASVPDIAKYLLTLMQDGGLRRRMGEAGRKHVTELFDYRQVARRFVKIVSDRLGNSIDCGNAHGWTRSRLASIDRAKEAALRVLLHNARGPFQGLPRTAGWGYPEPYTRDLMISALGFLATGNEGACGRTAAHTGGAGNQSDAARPHPIARARSG